MPCETARLPGQTIEQRKVEVREAIAKLSAGLVSGGIKVAIGPTGAIAFVGWDDRKRVTDNCGYRFIMATGSALAKIAITKAEQMAGRTINRQAMAQGHHAHMHDGQLSWHHGH